MSPQANWAGAFELMRVGARYIVPLPGDALKRAPQRTPTARRYNVLQGARRGVENFAFPGIIGRYKS